MSVKQGLTIANFCSYINTVKSHFTDTHLIWTPHTCTVHTSCELVSAYVRYSRRTLWTILWPITDLEKAKDKIRLINVTMAVRTLSHRKKNYMKNEYQLKLWCSLHSREDHDSSTGEAIFACKAPVQSEQQSHMRSTSHPSLGLTAKTKTTKAPVEWFNPGTQAQARHLLACPRRSDYPLSYCLKLVRGAEIRDPQLFRTN